MFRGANVGCLFVLGLVASLSACEFVAQPKRASRADSGAADQHLNTPTIVATPRGSVNRDPVPVPSSSPSPTVPTYTQSSALPKVSVSKTTYSKLDSTATITVDSTCSPSGAFRAVMVLPYSVGAPSAESADWITCGSAQSVATVDLKKMTEQGQKTFRAWFKNSSGQVSKDGQHFGFNLDWTPPDSPSELKWKNARVLRGKGLRYHRASLTPAWKSQSSPDIAAIILRVYSGEGCSSLQSSYDVNDDEVSFQGTSGKTYSFQILSRDLAGNESLSACSDSVKVELDSAAPTASIVASATNVGAEDPFSFTLTFSDEMAIKVYDAREIELKTEQGGKPEGCKIDSVGLPDVQSFTAGNDSSARVVVNVSGCSGAQNVRLIVHSDAVQDYADHGLAEDLAGKLVRIRPEVKDVFLREGAPEKTVIVGKKLDLVFEAQGLKGTKLSEGTLILDVIRPSTGNGIQAIPKGLAKVREDDSALEVDHLEAALDGDGKARFSNVCVTRSGPFQFRIRSGRYSGGFSALNAVWDFSRVHQVSGTPTDIAGISSVAVTADGIYSAGVYDSTVTLNNKLIAPAAANLTLTAKGGTDVYIIKQSRMGQYLASGQIATSKNDSVQDLFVDSAGRVFMLGRVSASVTLTGAQGAKYPLNSASSYLAQFNPPPPGKTTLELAWAKPISVATGSNTLALSSMVAGAGGIIYVAGSFSNTIDMAAQKLTSTNGSADIVVAKLVLRGDSPGFEIVWARTAGSAGDDEASDIALGPDGNPVIVGTHRGYHGKLAYFTGQGTDRSLGGSQPKLHENAFVAKLDSSGYFLWEAEGGGNSTDDRATAVAIAPDGSIFWGGYFKTTPQEPAHFSSALASESHDSVELELVSQGGQDAFLAKMSKTGELQWVKRFGSRESDAGDDRIRQIAVMQDRVFVSGEFKTQSFGAGDDRLGASIRRTNSSASAKTMTLDAFVMQVTPSDGIVQWMQAVGSPGDDSSTALAIDGEAAIYLGGTVSAGKKTKFGDWAIDMGSKSNAFLTRIGAR